MLFPHLPIHSFPFNLITFRLLSVVLNFICMVAVHKTVTWKCFLDWSVNTPPTWERKPQESKNSREASSLVKVGRKNCLITGRTIQKQNNHGERRPHLTTHSCGIWTLWTYVAARAESTSQNHDYIFEIYISVSVHSAHFLGLCGDPHKNQEGGWMMMNHVLHFHRPLSPPPSLLGRNLSFSLSALHLTSLLPFPLLVTTWMCHCF